eukprot:TRINITY_DN4754_c0_g1_i2.p1 TRINITY_DN4754_c0_g1~~TRINITY_DN4754_c0_g1_i2.p1  ORF type:complete len:947 (-),score=202.94 TRINITY_DN4754_c0_g1_i2:66-2906(-)
MSIRENRRQLLETDDDEVEDFPKSKRDNRNFFKKNRKWIFLGATIIAIIILIIAIAASAPKKSPSEEPIPVPDADVFWNQLRLPTTVKPIQYNLKIFPDMNSFNYTVQETVLVNVTSPTDIIVMHALDLVVDSASIRTDGGDIVAEISYNTTLDFVYLRFPGLKNKWNGQFQECLISLRFHGEINDLMAGFYRSSYFENNRTEWMATTDFEPTNARRAFVSFDEPEMKAKFNISVQVESSWKALSNMPLLSVLPQGNNQNLFVFDNSVKMSTYLVCFIVHRFSNITSFNSQTNTTVGVWTTPGTIDQAQYALEFATAVLTNYTNFYGVPYPLPKLDLIAIPDYPQGAMENWGLITFRQSDLLYSPIESSTSNQQRVATVIAHEFAHQWFGDYVTMLWWGDLWLNEGFASFMEYFGIAVINPGWEAWSQFIIMDRNEALDLDALLSSHPVAMNITNPDQIAQQFDAISYSKGGSLIRMLEYYMNGQRSTGNWNESNFTKGLHSYLLKYQYSNAQTSDLWNSLAEASGNSGVIPMMNSWTQQTGFPLVTISWSNNQLSISQERFLAGNNTSGPGLWWIPLTIMDKSGNIYNVQLKNTSANFAINSADLIANLEGTGFYRVRYTGVLRQNLLNRLINDSASVPAASRCAIMSDQFAMVLTKMMPVNEILDFIGLLQNEQDYTVWAASLSGIAKLTKLIELQPFFGDFEDYMLQLVTPAVNYVGFNVGDNDSHTKKLLRPIILRYAAVFGDTSVQTWAKEIFTQFMVNGSYIHPDLRSVVYNTAVENGGEIEYNFLLQRAVSTQVAAEKTKCLQALSKTKLPYLLQKTLQISLDSKYVRPQDTISVISYVASNVYGQQLAWNFVKSNIDYFTKRYGISAGAAIGRLIKACTSDFNSDIQLQEVEDFVTAHPIREGSSAVEQSLEQIRSNIQWIAINGKQIADWFAKRQSK